MAMRARGGVRGRGGAGGAGGGRGGRGGRGGQPDNRIRVRNLVPRYEENMRVNFRTAPGNPLLVGVITKVETFSSMATGRRFIRYGVAQYHPGTNVYSTTHRILENLIHSRA